MNIEEDGDKVEGDSSVTEDGNNSRERDRSKQHTRISIEQRDKIGKVRMHSSG
jgi:hypothetical protein